MAAILDFSRNPRWRPFEHIVHDMIKILDPDYMGVATGFDLLTALIIKIWRKIGFSWRPSWIFSEIQDGGYPGLLQME